MKFDKVVETERAHFSLPLNTPPATLTIPSSLVSFAQHQRDTFLAHNSAVPADEGSSGPLLVPAEAVALFIHHVAQAADSPSRHDLVLRLWMHLEHSFIGCATDIHSLTGSQLSGQEERQRRLISAYYSARSAVGAMRSPIQSALLQAQADGEAQIHGLFGGQGNNKHYFDEIRFVWDTYAPLVGDFVISLSSVLNTISRDERIADQYPHGLDVLQWLTSGPESLPDDDYLISAPVSFPLIGLLQLAHIKAVCMGLGVGPEDFPRLFGSLAGHSQGVVVAAAVATASDWASFQDAAIKAVTILFWIGSRC